MDGTLTNQELTLVAIAIASGSSNPLVTARMIIMEFQGQVMTEATTERILDRIHELVRKEEADLNTYDPRVPRPEPEPVPTKAIQRATSTVRGRRYTGDVMTSPHDQPKL